VDLSAAPPARDPAAKAGRGGPSSRSRELDGVHKQPLVEPRVRRRRPAVVVVADATKERAKELIRLEGDGVRGCR
jgi:hypothetical protein